ncbi:5-dehydro-4-deoxy-D-glucuronate isomerase [Paenibacillus thermoaerophilus]|uniref:4-deoxy-L-threo-5-hexosulose-uronate ketol-isomerase n=1 Tax=Paenibacillus thermoaerophilus TaxID=1215385 RepID=A0ABW2UYB2_9BACL|nr:5-dehydro-4-deoxy-D-glucuronate isomerase [Paenibacillus thermoaerophilus]TMV17734.1 5-dehydro-4-deoxy-D-glucuronate isomerase [Paenibacillus thermoaerophilus]
MEIRFQSSPAETKTMDTARLRQEYLIDTLFQEGKIELVYTHVDRLIVGSAVPTKEPLFLPTDKKVIGVDYFLERREIGVLNIGPKGIVTVDGTDYELDTKECLYIGKGNKEVWFKSADPANPARFYLLSTTAHASYPTVKVTADQAEPTHLGSIENSNERTIYKYIHAKGAQSCQLVMGLTELKPGNMWNTMPSHVHNRRSEVYLYFNVKDDAVVFHMMGEPTETRHIVVRNEQAVISPTWSIHSGVGTSNYSFIWGMGGENIDYGDMDPVVTTDLR